MTTNNDLSADERPSDEFYASLMIRFGLYSSEILRAVDLVGQYVRREKRILVGGMAVDLALRKRGAFLYSENTIADHDFFTPKHSDDAYEIGQWLIRTKYSGISVIGATHPSTMRVRVNFEPVADCTYMPPVIYDRLPPLFSKGYIIIHPNFQMINQHIALSKPYEGKPMENILSSRWKKDMERYDLLYEHYPLYVPREQFTDHKMREVKLISVKGQCIAGMAALIFWLQKAEALGFKQEKSYGSFNGSTVRLRGPVAIFTNDLREMYAVASADQQRQPLKCYNRLIDHLPRCFKWRDYEIYDNENVFIAATEYDGVHYTNLQHVMVYLLSKLLIEKVTIQDYFYAYLTCRELVKWASVQLFVKKKKSPELEQFLPVVTYYGKHNVPESYLIMCDRKANKKTKLKPPEMFQHTLIRMTVPDAFRNYDYKQSWVFDFDGQETAPFYKSEPEG